MRSFNLYSRACICLSMLLTICHPMNQIAATTPLSTQLISDSIGLEGSLENGISYTFFPSSKLKGGSIIKFSCFIPTEEQQSAVSLLTQHALFYGTEKYNRDEFAKKLNALGLDIEADPYVYSGAVEKSFQFSLSDQQPEKVGELLELINQMVFYPTLKMENVELARTHLTSQQDDEKSLQLQCVTTTEIQQFHAQWYQPKHMNISFLGFEQPQEILSILSETWDSPIKDSKELLLTELLPAPQKLGLNEALENRVDWSQDNQSWVVDGKIWMKEPTWINKSENGKKLGAFLTILGVGGAIIAIPFSAAAMMVVGLTSLGTGIYFLACDYLKDPEYVDSLRQKDLQNGCAHAYKNKRAGITLTPYERRTLFLQEMIDHPHTLSSRPILLLADLYQLNDPVCAEIFTAEELNVLTRLKRDFVQQRNQYKFLKEMLERELAAVTAPYALARDAALQHAKDVYNQNFYIATKYSFQISRDERIADIEKAYNKNDISLKEKEEMIQQAHEEYERSISTPEFKLGLSSAELILIQMQTEIQATYNHQVEISKQFIQYYQRMEYYNQGLHALVNYFEGQLHGLLTNFPVYLSSIPDYIDLR